MASTSSSRPSQSSKLLNDYRNNRIANLQLADLGKNVLEFARDPLGSRFINQKLGRANPTEEAHLMDALRGHVLTLATHMCGCHVIKAALESLNRMSQIEYGCRVIQRVLEHCTEQQKRPMLEQLLGNVLSLTTDQYGSYVIQHVIKHRLPEDRERIVRSLHDDITSMSVHECDRERIVRSLQGNIIMNNGHLNSFCSVIHKCFIFGTMEQRNALIDEFCADNGSGSPPLLEMIKHPFGNKVVQKMMDVADFARRQKIMLAIKTAPLKSTAKRSSESFNIVQPQQQRRGE
uniref:PUM-HD domain-containing protein n=1 Tax=Globodera rostochiensis TaxID=31243 RepID=A0A914GZL0_GLORO